MGMAAASLIALGAGFLYWRSAQNKQALLAEPVTESVEAQHAVQKTTPLLTASAKSATTDMSGEKPREEERILVVIQGRGGGDILEMAGVSRWWGEGV